MSQTVPTPGLLPEFLPQAAVLVANMIEAYLDAYHPLDRSTEVNDDHQATFSPNLNLEDHAPAPVQESVRLHSSIDAGPSVTPSGEHKSSVCAAGKGTDPGMERM